MHGRYIRFLGFNLIFPHQLFINLSTFFIFHFFIFTFYTLCTFCSIKMFSFQCQGLLSYFFSCQNKTKCRSVCKPFIFLFFFGQRNFEEKVSKLYKCQQYFSSALLNFSKQIFLETLSDNSLKLKIMNVIFFLKRIKIEWMIPSLTFLRYNYNKIPQAND